MAGYIWSINSWKIAQGYLKKPIFLRILFFHGEILEDDEKRVNEYLTTVDVYVNLIAATMKKNEIFVIYFAKSQQQGLAEAQQSRGCLVSFPLEICYSSKLYLN